MEPAGPAERGTLPDAEEFVRFCYRRRRVCWPELYDEMCAVASRGLYRGMGPEELGELGIGFSLYQTPRLAAIVGRVVADEQAQRARLGQLIRRETRRVDPQIPSSGSSSPDVRTVATGTDALVGDTSPDPEPGIRLALAAVGA
ncbi:MAG: hypothetical protein ACJ77N_11655 [Chloroflexota bacterium]|jgi:hypothetical protein